MAESSQIQTAREGEGAPLPLRVLIVLVLVAAAGGVGHGLVIWCLRVMGFGDQIIARPSGPDAAKWIGVLERMITASLVLAGAAVATVFIFAVKGAMSLYRITTEDKAIAERNPHHIRDRIEYLLVGTMVSYLTALGCGFLGLALLGSH